MPIINIIYQSQQRPQYDPQSLIALGPQISVDILPPVVVEKWYKNHNQNIASKSYVPALIDTGASVTGIDRKLLKDLNYPPLGITNLVTPSGTAQTNIYLVRLVIPSNKDSNFPPNVPRIIIDNVRAIAVDLSNQRYKVLLGRDVLRNIVMIYNGPHALITLGY